jgi:CheY-like chemotaxis protein
MTAKRVTVLLVDDSADILNAYQRLLAARYEVKTATNADEAFQLLCEWRPDILITDISMPGRSGLDLITQVRSDLAAPLPRIGVISGFPDFERAARSRGAEVFLLKPVDASALQNGIMDLLRPPVFGSVPPAEVDAGRRAASVRDAERLVEHFVAANPNAADLATRATEDVARYLGASTVLLLLARSGDLEVFASSDPKRFRRGTAAGGSLGYAASVIASCSTLYIPTRGVLADLGELPGSDQRLAACAAVRAPLGTPMAGLAILSERDRPFEIRDLRIVEDLAGVCHEVLLGRRQLGSSYAGASRFQTEPWLRRLLDRELEWVGKGLAVSVMLANVQHSPADQGDQAEAIVAQLSDHMIVAMRHQGQLAAFKCAADAATAREHVRRCLLTIDQTLGVSKAATLTISNIQAPRRSEVAMEILEGLLSADVTREPRTVVNATLVATAEHIS